MTKAEKFTQQPPATVRSSVVLPNLACDCHGHIFPDPEVYPTFNETMPFAPAEMFLDVHAQLGFGRAVLVQGGAYKFDNRAMLDALDQHPDILRGVALLPADTTEETLDAYARRNVRALRFTSGGASRIDVFPSVAPMMKSIGLHAELFIGLEAFVERASELMTAEVPLVLDHLAGPFDPATDLGSPAFGRLLDLLASGGIWVKLTPQRNSRQFPGYVDVRPFQDALIAARPDRMVWGSDWPFPNMSEATPDLGDLLTLFGDWVSDAGLRRQILVENPDHLYRFS